MLLPTLALVVWFVPIMIYPALYPGFIWAFAGMVLYDKIAKRANKILAERNFPLGPFKKELPTNVK